MNRWVEVEAGEGDEEMEITTFLLSRQAGAEVEDSLPTPIQSASIFNKEIAKKDNNVNSVISNKISRQIIFNSNHFNSNSFHKINQTFRII